ncbi:MAG: patatin-like phospholipase family protein [Hyphomicrobiaceae bacterium]
MNEQLQWHLDPASAPKRILSLDGGGVRGLITLGILDNIERLLAARSPDPDAFRLSDYFDLIAGTSTGSIIATGLALGWKVERIKKLYEDISPKAFRPRAKGLLRAVFDADTVERFLKKELGNEPLQSDKLKTGLMICAKRIDTGSPWVLTNNPAAKYWESPDKRHEPNKEYQLWMLVRASTAAPLYYNPVEVTINPPGGIYEAEQGLFIDGAVGGHNNPSLQALLVATLPSYGFGWPKGASKLFMVSVGTGFWRMQHSVEAFHELYNYQKATAALTGMVQDTVIQGVVTMQALSAPRKPWRINSEIGDMRGERIVDDPVLTYQRFDAMLDPTTVARVCNIRNSAGRVEKLLADLRQIGNVDRRNLQRLFAIGHDVGNVTQPGRDGIEPEDFPSTFDPPRVGAAAERENVSA